MYQGKATTKLVAVMLAAVLALVMAACSSVSSSADAEETQATEGAETEGTSQAELPYVELPEAYFITYSVTDEDGVITEVSKAADAAGNIYYKTADEEVLYCLENGNYTLYLRTGDTFTAQEDAQYTEGNVEEATADFSDYAGQANWTKELMDAVKTGEDVVAGRNCTLYTASLETFNYKATYTFAVDQETGVCLSWSSTKEISGHKQENQEGFICTRFDTEVTNLTKEMLG